MYNTVYVKMIHEFLPIFVLDVTATSDFQ